MKRILISALFVVATTSLVLAQAQEQKDLYRTDIKQELVVLERKWDEAYPRKDIATLTRIMADDIVIIDSSGRQLTKAKYVGGIGVDDQIESNVRDNFEVRVYRDAAVVRSRLSSKGKRAGKVFHAQFQVIDVYEKRDGRWQCVFTQATQIERVGL